MIHENSVLRDGGGLGCNSDSDPTLIHCVIARNTCGHYGGGLYAAECNPMLIGCRITNNASAYQGGGAHCALGNSTFVGYTISGNSAASAGGGIHSQQGELVVCHGILWADLPQEIHLGAGSNPLVTYCAVAGGWAGNGNLDADPRFVDPDGPDDDPATWEDNDFHLADDSPCIDAGDPGYVSDPDETDLAGNPRVRDGDGDGVAIIDMGVYEYVLFVPGDLHCDGAVEFDDIHPFVLALTSASEPEPFASYYAAFPECDPLLADVNEDGWVDFRDINPFVLLLTGGR